MSRLEGKETENKAGLLSDIIPKEWYKDPESSFAWVQIFTSLLIPWKNFIPALKGALKNLQLDEPVSIAYLKMSGLELNTLDPFMFAGEDGVINIHIDSHKKEFPLSNYVALITPYKNDGDTSDYIAMKSRLSVASSLISIHMGLNFMRDKVYDGKVGVSDGSVGGVAQTSRIPQTCEGPFIHKDNWDDIEEIASQLFSKPLEVRNRLLLGLEFFDKAIRQDNGFFNYWTALEVICNGRSGKIKERIRSCYRFKSVQQSDDIGFKKIAQWRHDYFHKGKEAPLKPDVERYIQLLILDLFRHEVSLHPKSHVMGLMRADGYDLSPIGLANNKKEE